MPVASPVLHRIFASNTARVLASVMRETASKEVFKSNGMEHCTSILIVPYEFDWNGGSPILTEFPNPTVTTDRIFKFCFSNITSE